MEHFVQVWELSDQKCTFGECLKFEILYFCKNKIQTKRVSKYYNKGSKRYKLCFIECKIHWFPFVSVLLFPEMKYQTILNSIPWKKESFEKITWWPKMVHFSWPTFWTFWWFGHEASQLTNKDLISWFLTWFFIAPPLFHHVMMSI